MENQNNDIVKYYSSIDKNIINNLCQNNNLKNLINLSTQSDIYVFNKKNKKLKSKKKLLNECNQIKNKELKSTSSILTNLAKLNSKDTDDIKNICKKLENKMTTIDKMISYINEIDSYYPIIQKYDIKIIDIDQDQYLECYSNC